MPDATGHFALYGGVYVPETLMTALEELGTAYEAAKADPAFQAELKHHLKEFAGRPTELYFAERLTAHCGGAKIYFKREDLLHTGVRTRSTSPSARRCSRGAWSKKRIIAETGAGQHGRGHGRGLREVRAGMRGLHGRGGHGAAGAECFPDAAHGRGRCGASARPEAVKTLSDAINESFMRKDWVTKTMRTTHYILGTAYGAHPYPMMVRDFHRVIGRRGARSRSWRARDGCPTS